MKGTTVSDLITEVSQWNPAVQIVVALAIVSAIATLLGVMVSAAIKTVDEFAEQLRTEHIPVAVTAPVTTR